MPRLPALAVFFIATGLASFNCDKPAQAADTSTHSNAETKATWKEFSGTWIRYNGNAIIEKIISEGHETHNIHSLYGQLWNTFSNPMVIEQEGKVRYYQKINTETGERFDRYAFKLINGYYFEYNRQATEEWIAANTGSWETDWQFRRASHPVNRLISAARSGDVDSIKELLDSGVDVDSQVQNSYTPLAYAAAAGHINAVETLIASGADVNRPGPFLKTPLLIAMGGDNIEVIDVLLAAGADFHWRMGHGGGMLNEAVFWGHPKVVFYCLEKGAKVGSKLYNGSTPLHTAAFQAAQNKEDQKTYLEIIKLLVEHGGDLNAESDDGHSARKFLEDSGEPELIKFIEAESQVTETPQQTR